jgi:predicted ATP-dependent protease
MRWRVWRPTARLAEHQGRLSARIGDLFQLVSEADFIRQLASDEMTDAGHIERALKAKATRTGRVSRGFSTTCSPGSS